MRQNEKVIQFFVVILYVNEKDKEMGLTNSRRWWRAEETSAIHPSSANIIDQEKTKDDEEEKNNEVCF